MRTTGFMALILAAPIVFSAPAYGNVQKSAEAPASFVSHAIVYEDLDLATPHGAATLQRRASLAVEAICADAVGPAVGGTDYRFAMMKCEQGARDQIRPRIESLLAAAPDRRARTLAAGLAAAQLIAAR